MNEPATNTRSSGIKILEALGLLILLGAMLYGVYAWQQHRIDSLNQQLDTLRNQLTAARQIQAPVTTYITKNGDQLLVYWPLSGAKVSSPLPVIGEVPGNWSFEASFPVQLKDASGKVIAQAPAQVLGDWMTDQLVPFSVKLTYPAPPSGSGTLVLVKDNPSGLPANDDSVSIPVTF